jgi:Transcription elongation factor, N-terminal
MRQVVATDGVIKGWCPTARKNIYVVIEEVKEQIENPVNTAPLSRLEDLKQKREKVLKTMVSAKEDGDIKENTAFLEAREELTILDYKIKMEEDSLRKSEQNK